MLLFFTDPHLGLRRQAHTTPSSLKALRERLYQAVENIYYTHPDTVRFCLGDWFDKSHNDEETIARAWSASNGCDWLLGGNHDMDNNATATTSLDLLYRLGGSLREVTIVKPVYAEANFARTVSGDTSVYMIGHHATQELFEEAMGHACTATANDPRKKFLLLHCNYDSPFAESEASLNLSEENAEYLLEHFDYVMLGHEHQPRELFQGRLIILGNTHPTSFADISPKRIALWDGEKLTFENIWHPDGKYYKVDYKAIDTVNTGTVEFLHVTGEVSTGEVVTTMRRLRELWKQSPNLLMLRIDIKTAELDKVERKAEALTLTLPQRIAKELEGKDEELLALWNELTGEV